PWGRHSDHETTIDKVVGRSIDVQRVRRKLKSQHFDVMVVKTSHEVRSLLRDLPLLTTTRHLVPKIVLQFHGGRSDLLVAPGSRGFKAATAAAFALSDGTLLLSTEEARESHRFWPRARFRVVCNPFAGNGFEALVDGDPRQLRTTPLSFLFVGRLIREKGIVETVDAFAALSRQHDCRLVIVGDGPMVQEVEQRIAQQGLEDRVTLAGFLEGPPLHAAYRAADVFVFPSYREGFPTAVTEAMAAGLPVVTTQLRGMADHLVPETNALFVEPGDTAGLTAALERVAGDPDLRSRMGAANRAKVAQFAPEPVARHYLEMLEELVEPATNQGNARRPMSYPGSGR